MKIWNNTKEVLIFIIGALGFGYEVVFEKAERFTLVLACMTLMGVPIVSKLDNLRKNNKTEEQTKPTSKIDGDNL